VKGTQANFFNAHFRASWQNRAPLHSKTERVAETALRASWFWPPWARFAKTWGICCSPGDCKLTPDGLGLQWNGHNRTFWTLTFESMGRIIALLHFKTVRVAKIALRASWFWPPSTRFPGTWGIFSTPRESKLTPDSLGLQWNEQTETVLTLTLELLGRNIAPLHFKTDE